MKQVLCPAFAFLITSLNQTAYGVLIRVPADQPMIQAGIDAAVNGDVVVLPAFDWPQNCGSYHGAVWYAALTNPQMTQLVGEVGTWTFGWS